SRLPCRRRPPAFPTCGSPQGAQRPSPPPAEAPLPPISSASLSEPPDCIGCAREATRSPLRTDAAGVVVPLEPRAGLPDPEIPRRPRLRRPRRGRPVGAAGGAGAESPVHGRGALRRGGAARAGPPSSDRRPGSRAGRRPRARGLPPERPLGSSRALQLLRTAVPGAGPPLHREPRPLLLRVVLQPARGEDAAALFASPQPVPIRPAPVDDVGGRPLGDPGRPLRHPTPHTPPLPSRPR